MKKTIILISLFFIALLALTGCGNNTKNSGNGENIQGRRMPDFGQPKSQPDISGIVKSVIGNEVTIIKIERPNREDFADQEGTGERNEGEENSSPNLGVALNGGTGGIHGGGRGFVGRPGGGDTDAQAQMLEKLKEMSAGEETFTVPVGIQMLKPDASGSETARSEMVEANIGDIKQDKMINVWINKDVTDRKVASFVLITF
ncbi:hypothetical protein DRH27_04595 [Candidatus Falkowbacteria bacterium]|nr:MAG: hypothetical protein DRH27_04595 [Candidatus Falkowbacteria bacterium]